MSSDESKPKTDVLLIGGPTGNDGGVGVIRARDGRVELGELRAAKDGVPIQGDLVRLKQRPEHEQLFDVETLHSSDGNGMGRAGPAQVATESYRDNWEAIFSPQRKRELLN